MADITKLNSVDVPRVLQVRRNPKGGRDYIMADPHGAFSTLYSALEAVGFDTDCDRLFIVGDLIDRGPDSWMCAELLEQPWVFAVRGNHEDMLIELYKNGEPAPGVLAYMARRNGFGWWMDTSPARREAVLAAVRRLPVVIELDSERGTVGLVHGDVPADMDWPTFVERIAAGDPEVLHVALWGRVRLAAMDDRGNKVNGGVPNKAGVAGIGRLFVGHTPQWNGVTRLGNVYGLDTGAIFGEMGLKAEGRLTLARVACSTAILCAPRRRTLIDIREDLPGAEPSNPFGQYVNQADEPGQSGGSLRSLLAAAVRPRKG
jgi:serine/threonine protein phosphatase 1